MRLVAPVAFVLLPDGHDLQSLAALPPVAFRYVPTLHAVHDVDPLSCPAYCPLGQDVHEAARVVMPLLTPNVPAGHRLHSDIFPAPDVFDHVPGLQGVHATGAFAPLYSWYVPAGHAEQLDTLLLPVSVL